MPILLLLNFSGKIAAIGIGWRAPALAVLLWFGPDLVLGYHLFMPHAQGLVRGARKFATTKREVWLTLDDGPDPSDTPRILELLAAYQARATFFVVGKNAVAHPELIRAIVAGGHEIAHHTHTHPSATFWCASPARLRRELDEALIALRNSGITPTRFRPPVNHKNLWLARALKARRLDYVGWTARGLERLSVGPEQVADRVLRDLAPGNILLLHEGASVPAAIRVHAVRRVLERLTEEGYKCVVPSLQQVGLS